MNKQSTRRPLVADAPAEHQQAWFGYLNSGQHDLVSYETWQDWRERGTGRVEHWQIGKGSVPATPTTRSNS